MSFALGWHGAVLLLGFFVLAPTRLGNIESHPQRVAAFSEAVARIASRQIADDRVVAMGGRSILLVHDGRAARAVVLLHGLTDSPMQFFAFAQELFADGDNVYVPRLPHHAERAGNVGALAQITASELSAFGDSTVDVAQGLGDSVVVVGLSAGGTVAAWIGQYRADVQRVVLVAPALAVTHVPEFLRQVALRLALRMPNVSRASPRDSTEPDSIPGFATHAVAQTLQLGEGVRRAADGWPARTRELTVLLNAHDHTISNAAAIDLARSWQRGGAHVDVFEMPDSLSLPHDVIDPRHAGSRPSDVDPVLHALVHGERPQTWVAARLGSTTPTR
jgi:esterase/lipase